MNEHDPGGEVVDTVEGVTLQKRFEGQVDHLPAVTYELSSEREEPVTVRVIDPLPDELEPGDVGFFSSGEPGSWQIEGPKLVLRVELEPDESFSTACAARGSDSSAIRGLLALPEAFDVEPAIVHGKTPLIARSPEDRPASDDAPESRRGRAVGADEATSTASNHEQDRAEEDSGAPSDGESDQGPGVVDRFVAELREGSASEESVEFLQERLERARAPRSVEARLKQLQADLADVRAYTSELVEVLGEGDPVRQDRRRPETGVESSDGALEAIDAAVDARDADLAALREEVEALAAEVRATSADVDERIAEVEAELDDLAGFTDSFRSAFER